MINWYNAFYSQCWYRNTFMVNLKYEKKKKTNIEEIKRISYHDGNNQSWNNIEDSGCNFTCLAMIIGIDPARLATLLGEQYFFGPDENYESRYLCGETGYFVWDRNAPEIGDSIILKNIWIHGEKEIADVKISIVEEKSGKSGLRKLGSIKKYIEKHHEKGNHIVIGPSEHSLLVAGSVKDSYFLWDPDTARGNSITDSLAGRLTLEKVIKQSNNNGNKSFGFYVYSKKVTY